MLTFGELSMFISEDLYLLPNEKLISGKSNTEKEVEFDNTEEEDEILEVEIEAASLVDSVQISKYSHFNPVLFILDKPLSGLSEDTFYKLVFNALKLKDKDFTVVAQDDISFSKAEEVNSKKIVIFGSSFTGFKQKYKLYTEGEKLILLADSMDRIAGNKELKTELWLNLQLMFPA